MNWTNIHHINSLLYSNCIFSRKSDCKNWNFHYGSHLHLTGTLEINLQNFYPHTHIIVLIMLSHDLTVQKTSGHLCLHLNAESGYHICAKLTTRRAQQLPGSPERQRKKTFTRNILWHLHIIMTFCVICVYLHSSWQQSDLFHFTYSCFIFFYSYSALAFCTRIKYCRSIFIVKVNSVINHCLCN